MAIIFHPERCVPPSSRFSVHSFDGVRLEPGMNSLSEYEMQTLKNHPDFDRYTAWKAIEVIDAEKPVEPSANSEIADLGAYSVEDAEQIVWNTNDESILAGWLATETRKTLRQVINRRITQIKGGEE